MCRLWWELGWVCAARAWRASCRGLRCCAGIVRWLCLCPAEWYETEEQLLEPLLAVYWSLWECGGGIVAEGELRAACCVPLAAARLRCLPVSTVCCAELPAGRLLCWAACSAPCRTPAIAPLGSLCPRAACAGPSAPPALPAASLSAPYTRLDPEVFRCIDPCCSQTAGRLLDLLRRIYCFGLSLMKLDLRQESGRHTDCLNEVTE